MLQNWKQINLFAKRIQKSFLNDCHNSDKIRNIISSAHRATNFTNHEFQFPQFKISQNIFILYYKEWCWHFWVYCDANLKRLPCKNTQNINKQKSRCKNWGFVLVVQITNELNEIIEFWKKKYLNENQAMEIWNFLDSQNSYHHGLYKSNL